MSDEEQTFCANQMCQNILAPKRLETNHRKRKHCSYTCSNETRRIHPAGFWEPGNRDMRDLRNHKARLFRRYNRYHESFLRRRLVTKEQFEAMLLAQASLCAICREAFTDTGKTRLEVDHDHQTGFIRGVLCGSCNRGIGSLKDDIVLLKKAIEYLEDAKYRELLGVTEK